MTLKQANKKMDAILNGMAEQKNPMKITFVGVFEINNSVERKKI
jgi:hypothetical protein